VGGAATVWPILACVLAGGGATIGHVKHKIGFVGAAFLFCYFYFGQAK
jgi:hypothetical protein